MTDLSIQVAGNADDGHDYLTGGSWDNSWAGDVLGYYSSNRYRNYFRFQNVTIEKGATIQSARIDFTAYSSLSANTVNLRIYAEDADNAGAISSSIDLSGRALTSAYVDWSSLSAWTDGEVYSTPDIKDMIQEVVDRAGWSSGNSLQIHIKDNSSSSGAYRAVSMYNHIAGEAAQIYITYRVGEEISDSAGAGDSADGYSLTVSTDDQAGFGDSADGYDFKVDISDAAGIGDAVSADGEIQAGISDAAGIGDAVSGGYEVEAGLSDGSGMGDLSDAFNWTEWLDQNLDKAVARYYCTITGEADGEDDVEVPISSFQARKRNGYSTYLSVAIPGVAYADAISARSNGEIVVEMAYLIDGVESLREEILRADLEQINIYEGTSSRSITLIGHQEQTFVAKESRLYDPIYKQLVDGSYSFRFAVPDLWLNPGDTARVGDDAFTVDTVVYMVAGGGGQTVMEVQE